MTDERAAYPWEKPHVYISHRNRTDLGCMLSGCGKPWRNPIHVTVEIPPNEHYRRGNPETGCSILIGGVLLVVVAAIMIAIWLGNAGAVR